MSPRASRSVFQGTMRGFAPAAWVVAAALAGGLPGWAQYPGQIKKDAKNAPDLRAVAVLEWTGEPGKPKACRIIPITIYDGEKLQDAGVYLARPQPLALSAEVEYELEQNGKPFGLFDVKNAGQEQGSWVGFGDWKPMPKPKAVNAGPPAKIDEDIENDKPVLHRKKHAGDDSGTKGTGSGSTAGSTDADRPTLHKKNPDDSSGTASGGGGNAPAPDSDRPVLHKHADDSASNNDGGSGGGSGRGSGNSSPGASTGQTPGSSSSGGSSSTSSAGSSSSRSASGSPDPDRPTLKKGKPKQVEDIGHVDSVPDETDPDRPRLKRGKSSGPASELAPTLMGLPADMQQAVAVSDAKTRAEHPWSYSWANPDDEAKMKSQLEGMARQALGLEAPPAVPAPAPAHKAGTTASRTGTTASRTGATATHKAKATAAPAAEPAPLEDEQFRVFELAYGSGATMVLSARSSGPLPTQKFVTIIAQPDLYGNVRVLMKSVTDLAHLDETPKMRLVDAVDALADNRGELLFELRGDGSRQFALYRIYRGTAEKLFVSGGTPYATASDE